MKKESWIWQAYPGHFIAGFDCDFRLNTYVGGYIVSTIGELRFDRNGKRKFDDVAPGYKYETMVFKAKKAKYGACPYVMADPDEVACYLYKTARNARIGHLNACRRWSR